MHAASRGCCVPHHSRLSQVYSRVVSTLSARVFCLLLVNDLDGLDVTVGTSRETLRLVDFFPVVKKKVQVMVPTEEGERPINVEVAADGSDTVLKLKYAIQAKERKSLACATRPAPLHLPLTLRTDAVCRTQASSRAVSL
jgi:hypothetical protein